VSADHLTAHKAFRARLQTLEVCTTGSTTLEATATGYSRAAGSFLTDGFAVGMEVTPTGFTQTDTGVIEALTATVMTIMGGRTVQASGAGRTLSVGLPANVGWENKAVTPVAKTPYVTEQYVPGTARVATLPVNGGTAYDDGLWIVRWFAKADTGLGALRLPAQEVLTLFKPGTLVSAGLRILSNPIGPTAGQLLPLEDGWTVVVITIPWRLESTN
jgi:hypothetical protein